MNLSLISFIYNFVLLVFVLSVLSQQSSDSGDADNLRAQWDYNFVIEYAGSNSDNFGSSITPISDLIAITISTHEFHIVDVSLNQIRFTFPLDELEDSELNLVNGLHEIHTPYEAIFVITCPTCGIGGSLFAFVFDNTNNNTYKHSRYDSQVENEMLGLSINSADGTFVVGTAINKAVFFTVNRDDASIIIKKEIEEPSIPEFGRKVKLFTYNNGSDYSLFVTFKNNGSDNEILFYHIYKASEDCIIYELGAVQHFTPENFQYLDIAFQPTSLYLYASMTPTNENIENSLIDIIQLKDSGPEIINRMSPPNFYDGRRGRYGTTVEIGRNFRFANEPKVTLVLIIASEDTLNGWISIHRIMDDGFPELYASIALSDIDESRTRLGRSVIEIGGNLWVGAVYTESVSSFIFGYRLTLCGDGFVDAPEECEIGDTGCNSFCECSIRYRFMNTTKLCAPVCSTESCFCEVPDTCSSCRDNFTNTETNCVECIPGNYPPGLCNLKLCGDGVVDPEFEDCDGGYQCNTTSCKCNFGFNPYNPATADCYIAPMTGLSYITVGFFVGFLIFFGASLIISFLILRQRRKAFTETEGYLEVGESRTLPPEDVFKLINTIDMPLRVSSLHLSFGKGELLSVGTPIHESVIFYNPRPFPIVLTIDPCPPYQFTLNFTPSISTIQPGKAIAVDFKLVMHCTTVIQEKVVLVMEIQKQPPERFFSCINIQMKTKQTTLLDDREIELYEVVGQGAAGKVWRGIYRGRQVAVKIPTQESNQIPSDFLREVEFLNRVRCPQIIQFIGSVSFPGRCAIVMELLRKGNVARLMRKKPLPLLLRMKFALDCAKAVAYLHQSEIVHRDLKPENLLVFSLNVESPVCCKLSDFGISEISLSINKITDEMGGIGTLAYIAPEAHARADVEKPYDVYSFAIMLYEFLVWERAFPAEQFPNQWDIPKAVLEGVRPTLPKVSKVFPSTIQTIISASWEHEPSRRPTMQSIADTLDNFCERRLIKIREKHEESRKAKRLDSGSSEEIIRHETIPFPADNVLFKIKKKN